MRDHATGRICPGLPDPVIPAQLQTGRIAGYGLGPGPSAAACPGRFPAACWQTGQIGRWGIPASADGTWHVASLAVAACVVLVGRIAILAIGPATVAILRGRDRDRGG